MKMTKKEAKLITGGLSNTSKMGCKSYGLPARECITGSKLRLIAGSVCSECYAHKGMYNFPVVQAAQYRRLESIQSDLWVLAMVAAIGSDLYFRWHDSGDIQSASHLSKIAEVCRLTPNCKHWIPTKEKGIVLRWLKVNECPENLIIRLSAPMVNQAVKSVVVELFSSSVHNSPLMSVGHTCPAPKQDGECRDCRSCWNKTIRNVSYAIH